jgi:hypothetical protein
MGVSTLSHALESLDLLVPQGTLLQMPKCSPKNKERFSRLKNEKDRQVHAEMQMIAHLDGLAKQTHIHSYLGCSKYSCLVCWYVLKAHEGNYKTQGCHGKVYCKMAMPDVAEESPMGRAILAAREKLLEVFVTRVKYYRYWPREDSIGASLSPGEAPTKDPWENICREDAVGSEERPLVHTNQSERKDSTAAPSSCFSHVGTLTNNHLDVP